MNERERNPEDIQGNFLEEDPFAVRKQIEQPKQTEQPPLTPKPDKDQFDLFPTDVQAWGGESGENMAQLKKTFEEAGEPLTPVGRQRKSKGQRPRNKQNQTSIDLGEKKE